jgi:hypothetical protein
MRSLLAIALVAVPSLANAGPVTVGASVGATQQANDASPASTLGIFGRIAMTSRLGAQIELSRTDTGDPAANVQTASALLVVELAATTRWMPILLAGPGIERSDLINAHHIEGGLGLEYRARAGLTIGIDARMGGRSIDSQPQPLYGAVACCTSYTGPSILTAGEYHSIRLAVGARF